ncbi:Lipopolysaccharide export system ATP-binding protein LptB [Methylobacterium crusticola]|uniref:Lipopolysaccharide export system ATP-binding protein LptB n=1 Tax=Methylobacterium crusticola TaxID=1697972 RepID=A0ABQ4R659_9HYPH|nr:ABC transporter ATP-binding protein [Methylobacterium crusticola]GJD53133.1 Lipopolysaccharide export system ATP-binding protein LptB [Methylobacterium crusticola]
MAPVPAPVTAPVPVPAPVLAIEGLDKRFGGIVVADGIDLTLTAGRIVGLIGPNGAGKTSLFNLISGVFPPDAGTIRLDGQRLDGLAMHRRAGLGLARTWQNLRLFPSLSVLDNLMMGPRSYPGERLLRLALDPGGVRRQEDETRRRARAVLERTRLAGVAGTRAADLTFGQQKLVGVARALMNDARCLLLDEPMAGVEGQAYEIMQAVVREVAASGVAVCVVEHNVAFIRDLCDEGVFMFAGRVLARGPVGTLIADPRLTELYFGT